MEQTNQDRLHDSQLIYVSRKDTTRLLEVYVKRSISLNDGTAPRQRDKLNNWTSIRHRKVRRYSSDSSCILSLHDEPKVSVEAPVTLSNQSVDQKKEKPRKMRKKDTLKKLMSFTDKRSSRQPSEISTQFSTHDNAVFKPEAVDEVPFAQTNKSLDTEKPRKAAKKSKKKHSLWKSFVGFFTGKDPQQKEDSAPSPDALANPTPFPEMPTPTGGLCLPLAQPGTSTSTRRRKSKKRSSKKRLSFGRSFRKDGITNIESVASLVPPDSYYEKVTDELERIVQEVQDTDEKLTNEDVIDRIVALMKHEGDAIDNKLKENSRISPFFKTMTYSSFQLLADSYVDTESPSMPGQRPVPNTAPELVKLAFTLDFTARVASLSRHSNHIMGLGSRYLDERFSYTTQAVPDHAVTSDCE
ncbi:uncharacterized protein LOC134028302 [Osmerus eperlanus]|uniref:uncharacterized protein LOC134028302 n=1 Tax=Osmerus eperlanus TaxID=29151 RepID=UPI002E0ED8B1